jgi:phosphate/phosphite/phosphonate ABC transporter binding protein
VRAFVALAALAMPWVVLSTAALASEHHPSPIRIVPRGSDDPVTAVRRFKPLTEYLAQELGRPIELVLRGSYREVLEAFGRNEVDVVVGTALNFVRARQRHGAMALVKRVTEEGTTYTSVFVALESSQARRLEDLRGKRIAFSDPSSTSGYVMPRLMLARIGVSDPASFFVQIKFKGNQYDAIRAVLAGEVEVATVASFLLSDPGVEARRLRVIARSEPMELGPVFVNPRTLSPQTIARLRAAFLAIGATPTLKGLAATLQVRGFLPASDSDYRQIERIHDAAERLPGLPYTPPPEMPLPAISDGPPAASASPAKLAIIGALALVLLALVARRRVWEGLRGQFLLAFFLIILFVLVLVTATTYVKGQEVLRAGTRDSAVLLSHSVLLASRGAIMSNDRSFLQQYAEALARQHSVPISAVAFHDDRGRPLAESGRFDPGGVRERGVDLVGDTVVRTFAGGLLGREYFQVAVPVSVEGMTWGDVRLVFPLERMHQVTREGVLNTLILGLVAAVAGFCLADLLTRRIARPLKELVAGARAVSRGNLAWQASVSARNEVGELSAAFQAMTRNLQSHIDERIRAERLVLLGKLAAGIAHEVRNPLEAIKGAAQVIQAHATSDETARKFTRIIQEEVTGLDRFLTGFLELARPAPLRLGPVAVSNLVREVLALLEPVLSDGAVKVQSELADDLPPVQAESHQISQVVLNLCLNAIQAMPGGGTLTVGSRPSASNGQPGVELWVEDTGPGVPEAIRHQIFEPFITTKAEGSGLGLAVSRAIIERHKGRIWLTAEPGRGTTFRVWLPTAGDGTEIDTE